MEPYRHGGRAGGGRRPARAGDREPEVVGLGNGNLARHGRDGPGRAEEEDLAGLPHEVVRERVPPAVPHPHAGDLFGEHLNGRAWVGRFREEGRRRAVGRHPPEARRVVGEGNADRPATGAAQAGGELRHRPVGDEEESEFGHFITDESAPLPDEAAETTLRRETLEKLLHKLSVRERQVLILRYGLDGQHPRTLDEVGRTFNVTRERIRQIENQTLKKLRALADAQILREVA